MAEAQKKDSVARAPESGEHDPDALPVDRFTGAATPPDKTVDGAPAGKTPPGQSKVGEDFASGRQSAK